MSEAIPTDQSDVDEAIPTDPALTDEHARELAALRTHYEARLVNAHMRTEALRSGMIDVDGIKLADLSSVKLGSDDKLVGASDVIEALKRTKPWLFGVSTSSSSAAIPPSSLPPRPKSALEMSDDEYHSARAALIARRP